MLALLTMPFYHVGVIDSSEHEKSEASGLLLPMIKSFNGWVQEPFNAD